MVSTGSIQFTGSGQAVTLTVTEQGFTGSFRVTSQNPAIASVTALSASNFLITAGATGGTTTITVTDGTQTVLVQVSLAITSGTIT